jgi:hypothetical protein
MIFVALIAGAAMGAQDLLDAARIRFLASGRFRTAGLVDAAADWARPLAMLGGTEAALHGFTPGTLLVLTATSVGGYAGTRWGGQLARRWEARRRDVSGPPSAG